MISGEWGGLVDELDRWGEAGRVAALWWRDDDAVAATSQLADLLRLGSDVPVALAVIPALARRELAAALESRPDVAVLQHGWQHADRGTDGRKSEFAPARPAGLVAAEIAAGQARLKAMFGPRALPLLVPPWNRIADAFVALLPAARIAGLSVMASRLAACASSPIVRLDVHVDLVAWRAGRGFIGEAPALQALVQHLAVGRSRAAAPPVGILTHHRVMDRPAASFLERLANVVRDHPAARWVGAREMLPEMLPEMLQ